MQGRLAAMGFWRRTASSSLRSLLPWIFWRVSSITGRFVAAKTVDPARPPTGVGRPPTGVGRPPTGVGRPPTGVGRPPTGVGRPPTGVGRPPTGVGRPLVVVAPPAERRSTARAPGGGGLQCAARIPSRRGAPAWRSRMPPEPRRDSGGALRAAAVRSGSLYKTLSRGPPIFEIPTLDLQARIEHQRSVCRCGTRQRQNPATLKRRSRGERERGEERGEGRGGERELGGKP